MLSHGQDMQTSRGLTQRRYATLGVELGVWGGQDAGIERHGAPRAACVDGGDDETPAVCVQRLLWNLIGLQEER